MDGVAGNASVLHGVLGSERRGPRGDKGAEAAEVPSPVRWEGRQSFLWASLWIRRESGGDAAPEAAESGGASGHRDRTSEPGPDLHLPAPRPCRDRDHTTPDKAGREAGA